MTTTSNRQGQCCYVGHSLFQHTIRSVAVHIHRVCKIATLIQCIHKGKGETPLADHAEAAYAAPHMPNRLVPIALSGPPLCCCCFFWGGGGTGPFRLGKSFLLNFFLRYLYHDSDDEDWMGDESASLDPSLAGFKWAHGSTRDTTGALLSGMACTEAHSLHRSYLDTAQPSLTDFLSSRVCFFLCGLLRTCRDMDVERACVSQTAMWEKGGCAAHRHSGHLRQPNRGGDKRYGVRLECPHQFFPGTGFLALLRLLCLAHDSHLLVLLPAVQ